MRKSHRDRGWWALVLAGAFAAAPLAGCEDDDAGDAIEDAAEDAGEAVDDAVDEAADAVDDAVDEIDDGE